MRDNRHKNKKLRDYRTSIWHPPDMQSACDGISAERIADMCKVDLSTARRWKSGTSRIPYTAAVLLLGSLGAFSEHWVGWTIQGEDLISPDQWRINRNHALSVALMESQIRALEDKLGKQRDEFARVKEALLRQLRKYKTWDDKEEQPAPPEVLPQIRA